MKSLLFILIFSSFSSFAVDVGTRDGVASCQNRIKVVSSDLNKWIQQGGPKDLILSQNMSLNFYSQAMLTQIKKAKIKCVSEGDDGYPVEIEGTQKVCRFDLDLTTNNSFIKCDSLKFNSLNETEQYVLVHHEFAGLAGIEIPNGDDSDYSISNQISAYLVDTLVKRLAVHPSWSTESCTDATLASIKNYEQKLYTRVSLAAIDEIVELANSCKNDKVKRKAVAVLAMGTQNSSPLKTGHILQSLKGFCRNDSACAMIEIGLLAAGISSRDIESSKAIIQFISEILEEVPTQAIKNKAIFSLSSSCLNNSYFSFHCTLAIRALSDMKIIN